MRDNKRLQEYGKNRLVGPNAEKVTLKRMKEALLDDYRLKKNRSIETAEYFADNLIAYFGEDARAVDISRVDIDGYIKSRLAACMSNASINRETSCLRHMFRLLVDGGELSNDHVPAVRKLEEAEPRSGFVDPAEFIKLRRKNPRSRSAAIVREELDQERSARKCCDEDDRPSNERDVPKI